MRTCSVGGATSGSARRERRGRCRTRTQIRRRLRAIQLQHWKRKRTIARHLTKLGARRRTAWRSVYRGRQSLWALSHNPAVDRGLRNAYFAERGLVSLVERLRTQSQPIAAPVQLALALGSGEVVTRPAEGPVPCCGRPRLNSMENSARTPIRGCLQMRECLEQMSARHATPSRRPGPGSDRSAGDRARSPRPRPIELPSRGGRTRRRRWSRADTG